ncbi:filamentous hemagglutinin N-terminal domain-containing protein [Dyella sedimenti]|uniref:two-partner secretion domain-containing protein n=1 Tax=Dyella sedimenti TaxID=2919947 RepID=UPI001FAA5255|nr:filamentous hemagglutinin N-terminal domain-containing protein [Dyella sedimenti]
MNKHCYHIVFNQALGVFQAVSELARQAGRGAAKSEGIVTTAVRPVSWRLWIAFGWIGFASVASAQITGDPNAPGHQRPTVLNVPGAAPLINIQTPSAAGVSRNTYSRFNVAPEGAVLNNSRTSTQTQLAGAVAGNPWLATGTAKIILNEVTGAHPSQLNGYVEVAGDRAQVVIANPAGVACDGCGFINANRVTLTTGAPVISGGALDGYRVTGGAIQVNGAGLDASRADYTDLIARSVALNAGLWSPQLHVTTGANQVGATDGQVAAIQGMADKPVFALDVSALGGMYAHKITLLGTEQGVGVRNAGTIGAQAGDLVVTLDGRLENTGSLQSQDNARIIASGGVANSGTLSATRELAITTPADVDNGNGLLNAGRIAIDAGALRNAGGTIAQTGAQAMSLQASSLSNRDGHIGMPLADAGSGIDGAPATGAPSAPPGDASPGDAAAPADSGSISATPIAPLADGVLHITGLFDNDGGRISAAAGFDLAVDHGLFNDGGQLGLRQLTLTSGNLSNQGGTLAIDGAAFLRGGNVINDAGELSVGDALTLDVQNLSNRGGTLTHAGTEATTLSVTGTLDNTDGMLISAASSLVLASHTLINERGTITQVGTDGLMLNTGSWQGAGGTLATAGVAYLTAGHIDHRGATLNATRFTLEAQSLDNRGGVITASGDEVALGGVVNNIIVADDFDNGDGGILASNADLTLQANVFDNASGTVQYAGEGTLDISANTLHGAGGTLGSNGRLVITGSTTDVSGGTTSAQQVSITTGTLNNAQGSLVAVGDQAMQLNVSGAFDNTQGAIATNGALQLQAQSLINAEGALTAAGSAPTQVQVTDTFTNTGGTVATRGAATLQAGNLLNQHGVVQTGDGSSLTLAVNDLLDNSDQGVVAAEGDLTVTATTLDNTQGTLQHAGSGTLRIDAIALDGRDGILASNGTLAISGHATDLSGGVTQAQAIRIDTDTLSTAAGQLSALGEDALTLHVHGAFDNTGGTVVSNGALWLTAASLANMEGTLIAAGSAPTQIEVGGMFDNTHGTFASAGATTVQAGSLINQAGVLQAADATPLTLTIDGLLSNDDGTLQSNGEMELTAGRLSNRGGLVQTPQAIHASVGDTLDNTGGAFIANGNLDVQATTLLNRDTLSNGASTPLGLYGQQVTLNAHTFDNTQGQVAARDTLAISGGALSNAGGVLDGQGNVTITGSTLDNAGGQLIQRGDAGSLSIDLAQTLDNTQGGLIGAEGNATLQVGAFDNSGGATFALHDLNLRSTGNVLNRDAGLLQAGGILGLAAQGGLDNTGGAIDATSAATLDAASFSNIGGQLLAGNAADADAVLRISTTGTIDNRGGLIGNRGGDVLLSGAALDNSDDGTLVAQRDLTLDHLGAFDNHGGTAYATGTLSYQNGNATLDNTGGQLGAGDTAWLDLARITNTSGHLQANALWVTTPTLNNDGGEIDGTTVHATLATLNGIGRLYGAQWLDAHFTGDYVHLAGQRLESDGRLGLAIDGTLTNQGTLQTPGELDITADNLVNQGTINASADDGSAMANIIATGSIDNQAGASIAGDMLTLAATDITNASSQGITGDAVHIEADTLTNGHDLGTTDAAVAYGEGFIGASQSLDLRVAQHLANLDGDIYSGGDLTIEGRADGTRVATLDNVSSRIQAEGHGFIAADVAINRRRFIETEQYVLDPDEQYALGSQRAYDGALTPAEQQREAQLLQKNDDGGLTSVDQVELLSYLHRTGWSRVDHVSDADLAILNTTYNQIAIDKYGQRGGYLVIGANGNPGAEYKQTDTYLTGTRIIRESADSQIQTGGDLGIDLGTHLTNYASTIVANGGLIIDGRAYDGTPDARIANVAVTGQYTLQRDIDALVLPPVPVKYLSADGWKDDMADFPAHISTDILTAAGPVLVGSTIKGQNVSITGHDVTNTTVAVAGGMTMLGADGLAGPGRATLGDTAQVQAGSTTKVTGTQGHEVSGTDQVDGATTRMVGTADQPLPGYMPPSNGMYGQNADPSAPFLVTTAPRFAKGPSTSSDYLLQALGSDPSAIHKRLGDGYYEQNLVLDQILQLTGRRSLDGGDPIAQYQALMDNASTQAQSLGLALGAPLTSSQIASLSSDIVWLVDQVVDGQHVLVPVVYLSKATADKMRTGGALIAGDTVNVQSSGTVRNDGTISGTQSTAISADTLINRGSISGGDLLAIATRGDTVNAGALDANAIAIQAGGSVINAPAFDGLAAYGGTITAGAGGVQVVAAIDVINQGKIISAGDGVVVAGRDYVQNAATSASGTKAAAGSFSTEGNAAVVAGRDAVFDQSTMNAGQVAYIEAGRDAHFTAATVHGGTGIGVVAGQDIISDAVTDHTASATFTKQGKNFSSSVTMEDTARGSIFASAGDISMAAGRDIALIAATAQSDGVIGLAAGRDINLLAGEDTTSQTQDSFTKHGKTKTTTHGETIDITAVGTTISGAQGVVMGAGRDINAVAANVVSSEGAVIAHAERDINLLAAQNVHAQATDSTSTKKGTFSKKTSATHDEAIDLTAVGTTFSGKQGIAMDAGGSVLGIGATLRSSDGGIAVTAGDKVSFLAAGDTHITNHSEKTSRSGLGYALSSDAGTKKKEVTTQQVIAIGSTLDAKGPIVVVSGGDQTYQAANIRSDTGTALLSGGKINFVTATNSESYARDSGKHNVYYQATDHRQRLDTTEIQTSITGPVAMAAVDGITIGVGQKQGESQAQAIIRASQQQPGTGWIADAQTQPDIEWQSIDEVHINEHQHHEGLTPAAGAVVTMAAAYLTAGAASAWIGNASGAAAGSGTAMAAAGPGLTGATVSAGWANATLTGIAAGAAGGATGAAAQGYDWKLGALNGAIAGGISGGITGVYGETYNLGRLATETAAGCGTSMALGGNCGDGAKLAFTLSVLSWAGQELRKDQIESSERFKGVCDEGGNCYSNRSGESTGVDGDNFKLGGTRINRDLLETLGTVTDNPDGTWTFTGTVINSDTGKVYTLEQALAKQGGLTGGSQGLQGSIAKVPYTPGSFADRLVESFAGPHDWLGSHAGYNELGNAVQGPSTWIYWFNETTTVTNLVPASVLAFPTLLHQYGFSNIDAVWLQTRMGRDGEKK